MRRGAPPAGAPQQQQGIPLYRLPPPPPIPTAAANPYILFQNTAITPIQQHRYAPRYPPIPVTRAVPKGKGMTLAEVLAKAEAQDQMLKAKQTSPMKKRKVEKSGIEAEWIGFTELPDNVKRFVERCVNSCIGEQEKDRMMNVLKHKVNAARENRTFFQIDWDNLAAPLFEERKAPPPVPQRIPKKVETIPRKPVQPQSVQRKSSFQSEQDFVPLTGSAKKGKQKKDNIQQRLEQIQLDLKGRAARAEEQFPLVSEAMSEKQIRSRFAQLYESISSEDKRVLFSEESDDFISDMIIQGTCTELEKMYLRLTDIPEPETVRPENILKKSLKMVQSKWKSSGDYRYVSEQLKSIRQDLGIQHIKNEFTMEVYQFNARLAIETGDLSEFNQCQTQLFQLYDENPSVSNAKIEFIAYRILYYSITGEFSSLYSFLIDLDHDSLENSVIKHALSIREAVIMNDYHAFFELFSTAPNLGQLMLRNLAHRIRYHSLLTISKSYINIPVEFICKELGFQTTEECIAYISEFGVKFTDDRTLMDCKSSEIIDSSKKFRQVDASYCMPAEGVDLTASDKILTSDEIFKLSRLFVENGVDKIRITGGEPLVRKDAVEIISRINQLRSIGLRNIAMTTNGVSLKRKLADLLDAGLNSLNISLDTLDHLKFQVITRRGGHQLVLDAIKEAAGSEKLESLKINCVVMRNVNDDELIDFVRLTESMDVEIRFIEYMPFDGNVWSDQKMVSYAEMLSRIRQVYPEFKKITLDSTLGQTSKVYQVPGFAGRVGFISSMSDHFCGTCNRVRLTADGNLKVCLFGASEVNLKEILRNSANSHDPRDNLNESQRIQLTPLIQTAILNKKSQHAGMYNIWKHAHENRPMIRIGG